jgi:hypothetical protein
VSHSHALQPVCASPLPFRFAKPNPLTEAPGKPNNVPEQIEIRGIESALESRSTAASFNTPFQAVIRPAEAFVSQFRIAISSNSTSLNF